MLHLWYYCLFNAQHAHNIHSKGSAACWWPTFWTPVAAAGFFPHFFFFTRGKVDRLRAVLLTLHDGEMRDKKLYTFLRLWGFWRFFFVHHWCLFSHEASASVGQLLQQTSSHHHHGHCLPVASIKVLLLKNEKLLLSLHVTFFSWCVLLCVSLMGKEAVRLHCARSYDILL